MKLKNIFILGKNQGNEEAWWVMAETGALAFTLRFDRQRRLSLHVSRCDPDCQVATGFPGYWPFQCFRHWKEVPLSETSLRDSADFDLFMRSILFLFAWSPCTARPPSQGPTKVMGETEGGAEMGSDPSEHSANIPSQLLTTYRPFSLLTEPGSIQLSLKLD